MPVFLLETIVVNKVTYAIEADSIDDVTDAFIDHLENCTLDEFMHTHVSEGISDLREVTYDEYDEICDCSESVISPWMGRDNIMKVEVVDDDDFDEDADEEETELDEKKVDDVGFMG